MENRVYEQAAGTSAVVDEGLREYMLKVYNYMAGGLCVTALVAYLIANTSLLTLFFNISPDGRVLGMSALDFPNRAADYRLCFRLGIKPRHLGTGSGRFLALFGIDGRFADPDFSGLHFSQSDPYFSDYRCHVRCLKPLRLHHQT